jgi:hypothetical protein
MIWMNILLADYITWERQCQPLICSFIASLRGLNCRIGFWLKNEQEKQEIKLAHNYSPNLALLIQMKMVSFLFVETYEGQTYQLRLG